MVKGYVEGGLCRPLYLLNSVVFFLFYAGGIQNGDKTGPVKTGTEDYRNTNNTPVAEGLGISELISGNAGAARNRGFLFSFLPYPEHSFG